MKRRLNGVLLSGDEAGLSLNARIATAIFQGIRTRIAKKPYILVIFRGGGGGGFIMAVGFHPFFIVAVIVVGLLLLSLA